MEFIPIASSSHGNAYLVKSEGVDPLLLEAGISIKKLRESLSFGLSGLAGCLISHEHMDHAKAVKDLLKAGVDCYMHWQTADVLGVSNHHRVHTLDNYRTPQIKGWSVLTFPLEHDVPTLGFFIERFEEGLLFIPDTCFIRNRFKRVNIIAIECNHISEILSEHIQGGNIPAVVGRRIRHNHMSLETVIKTLRANDLSKCQHIYLLHLSNANSDEKKMIQAVQEATGIPTSACE